jgi:TDG/mug DNA glycosylase family protein
MTRVEAPHHDFDILAHGLDVVFCGINPPPETVRSGLSFANPANRFWRAMHLAGFTGAQLNAENGRQLLQYRCGLTAVVDRPTRRAQEVPASEFRRARPSFEAKIRAYDPGVVAFLGKRALSGMLGGPDIAWGRQADAFAGRTAWVIPNPSGLNRSFSLEALVRAYSELHLFITRSAFPNR